MEQAAGALVSIFRISPDQVLRHPSTSSMKPHHSISLALILMACAFPGAIRAAEPYGLPELRIDLRDVAPQQCREREWKLAHSTQWIVICHVSKSKHRPKGEAPDALDLIRLNVELREATADEALAEGVYAMQHALEVVPHRSLDARWRVLIGHGIWGCQLKHVLDQNDIVHTDPCTTHRYDAEGRPLGKGFPALAIPPYAILADQIVIGRLPPNANAPAIPLPPLELDAPEGTATDQWIRTARWGDTARAKQSLANGQDINAKAADGTTALLIAVQRKQNAMVAFLLDRKADPNLGYPNGPTPLEMAELVDSPEIAALLKKAGATGRRGEQK